MPEDSKSLRRENILATNKEQAVSVVVQLLSRV